MKILAIRGCNLASLAGEFEIDLVHGSLASAGVFAIVGPTGAGKSTLLDAMCVALFDRTPRLANRSTVVVGRQDDPAALGAQDVRSLLRRGASTGWAEVDFESGDARRYRARWSVRRARGASDGRFQNQQVTLTAIDGGEQLGGTKTETLEAIHQRLGLSFDQFRRSALLAQGEFAAFLRADGKDRSELLERMTGTEIYSRLSIAAHVKAALAEQQLRDRHGAALAIAVLADDERARAEASHALAKQARDASRVRLAEGEALARWLRDAERKQRELAEADVARIAADGLVADAAAERAELALRRRAEQLRTHWAEAERLDRQLAHAHTDLAAASDAVLRGTSARDEVAAAQARLTELHAPIREARIAAGIVERTRAPEREVLARAVGAAADATWLLARRTLAGPVASWRELEGRFTEHAALAAEIAQADRTLAEHAERRKRLAAQRADAEAAHQHALGRLAEAQREAATFQQRRGLSLDAARRQEDEARLRCGELERLVAVAAEARAAATARTELDGQLAALETAALAEATTRQAAERERDIAAAQRADRAHALDELRKAAGYQHARAELVAHEPCPLCGATEHPWRDRGAFDAAIGEAQARLAEASARGDAAVRTLAAIDARDHHRTAERTRIVSSRATADASHEAAQRAWRGQLGTLGELMLVDDAATPAAEQLAAERADAARARLEAARAARSHAEAHAKASAEAQAKVQARQADVEHHARALRELDASLATLAAASEGVRGERSTKVLRHRELADAIASEVVRWFHEALTAAERRVIEGAAASAEGLAACRRVLAELARAWAARADAIADLDGELASARSAGERAIRDAEHALAEQRAHRDAATTRRDALAHELAETSARLDDARIAAGFERDELRRLLAAEPSRVDELALHLEQIDRAADRARTLVGERRRIVEDHAATRPPSHADAVAPDLDALAAAVAAADHEVAALAATLAADADARVRRAAALAALATAETAAQVDRVLGEVIGSHDGKLFRSFAQSLTLDGLLAVANSHLEELAPRYQLERVPKHDLELQVIDRDLGNEIRSVQSLSGGESFLVSLALALGLSSMSAHDVRVRTLLIDEGFGTLDPATLDSALAVLDALQATGRQVGIISHVPALVERVGAHVRVSPKGAGRSEVVVSDG